MISANSTKTNCNTVLLHRCLSAIFNERIYNSNAFLLTSLNVIWKYPNLMFRVNIGFKKILYYSLFIEFKRKILSYSHSFVKNRKHSWLYNARVTGQSLCLTISSVCSCFSIKCILLPLAIRMISKKGKPLHYHSLQYLHISPCLIL